MPQVYYGTDTQYPGIILPILERIRYYICKEVLYSDEDYSDSQERFIRTDIGPYALRDASKVFQITNIEMPFTAYSFDEDDMNEDIYNTYARTGHYFADVLNTTVSAMPMVWELPMISFFHKASDYIRALRILTFQKAKKVKLDVPVVMNGVDKTIPIIVEIDNIDKGSYAFEFEQQLTTGKIHDITHNLRVHYFDYQLGHGTVAPVDDIEVALAGYTLDDYRNNTSIASSVTVPSTPEVSSSDPEDEATDIPVDYSIILTFNVSMNEESVNNALSIDPYIPYELVWSDNGQTLAIDPTEDFQSNTKYTIEVIDTAYSARDVNLAEDYSSTFITED